MPAPNPLRGMKSLNELQRREVTEYLQLVFDAKEREYDERYAGRRELSRAIARVTMLAGSASLIAIAVLVLSLWLGR